MTDNDNANGMQLSTIALGVGLGLIGWAGIIKLLLWIF